MLYFSFHLKELGFRFMYIILFTIIGYVIYSEYFIEVTLYILDIAKIKAVQIATPIESIISYLQLSIKYSLLTISFPLFLFHLYFYIRPALIFTNSRFTFIYELGRIFLFLIIPKIIIIITGTIYPFLIQLFFLPYKNMEISTYINFLPKLDEIIRLYFNIGIIVSLLLILPILIINYTYKYCKGNMLRQKKIKDIIKGRQILYFLLTTFISFLTPPDILTLFFITFPLIFLIELSSFLLLLLFAYSSPSLGIPLIKGAEGIPSPSSPSL